MVSISFTVKGHLSSRHFSFRDTDSWKIQQKTWKHEPKHKQTKTSFMIAAKYYKIVYKRVIKLKALPEQYLRRKTKREHIRK